MLSAMEVIFTVITKSGPECDIGNELREEMILLEMMLPCAQFNLKSKIDPMVTASDACETGGGLCYAPRLTREGEEEAKRMMEGEEPTEKKKEAVKPTELQPNEAVLVVDLFAGIGGLTTSLEKAGIKWKALVIVEKDKDCRRLLRRKYPEAYFFSDVRRFDEKALRSIAKKVPNLSGIIVGGGSPCQGLSKLSSQRRHLNDQRSSLFYEASRIFKQVEKLSAELKLWFLKLLENVVADKGDIRSMSNDLGIRPVLVDARHLSRARRPRLFWVSVTLAPQDDVEVIEKNDFDVVIYKGPVEPMELFLEEGSDWPGGLRDESLRFPTFTRSIPRKSPPPDPVGLADAGKAALARWQTDGFRYPPYVYHDDFMVLSKEVELRPLTAVEREVLMGFPKGHVKLMLKKTPETKDEKRAAEDMMCSALGNSFHTNAVAALLDHCFFSMGLKERKGPTEVNQVSMAMQVGPEAKGEAPETENEGLNENEEETMSVMGAVTCEDLEKKAASAKIKEETLIPDEKLSQKLVAAYIRRQEYRGSDVRLDLGSLYRPDSFPRGSVQPGRWQWRVAHSYAFKEPERINVLELRALVLGFERRL